ncbi:MAG: HEPN domain-containing protein [Candidatus Micrarchaeia archaeon]
MNLKELLQKRLVEKSTQDLKLSAKFLSDAHRDISAAEDNLKTKHPDWALAIAYNAMLSAGMALMAYKGYRTFAESHHVAVVQFCAAVMPPDSATLVSVFNRYRVRRHDVIYGESSSVGEDEARKAIENTKKFVEQIEKIIKVS